MTYEDFLHGISELRTYYGESIYPAPVSQAIWNIVHPLSAAQFSQVIERLVEDHPRTPTVASIKKAANPMLKAIEKTKAQEDIRELESQGQTCALCRHTGFVDALERSSGKSFAFRCTRCSAANVRKLSASIPEWTPGLERTHMPVTTQTLPGILAAERTKQEQLVLLNWLKRVRARPSAAKEFTMRGGVLPTHVIAALLPMGIDCGPIAEARAGAEKRIAELQAILARHKEVPF